MENKIYLEAPITIQEETAKLKEKASKVIELPPENLKQPDLMYFSAILVSSGENLNHAYFMGSELVSAEGSIINKALDVEHSEDDIIGHIYERAYIDKEGNRLDLKELSSKEVAHLDGQDMHIAIAGIIYKNRFPNIAQEVADNKFCVSMECYYQNYDVKIGEMVISKNEAEALGLASQDDSILGKIARVIKKGKELATGKVTRVLRGICFSGCGIVKHPANPASIIMETANEKEIDTSSKQDIIILDYDKLEASDNNLTSIENNSSLTEDSRDGSLDDSIGICVNYKRRIEDKEGQVVKEDWCTAYDRGCTSFSRDTTDPDCLRNQDIRRFARAAVDRILKKRASKDRRKELLDGLKAALREAVKTQSR
jgi:hypothetical protein